MTSDKGRKWREKGGKKEKALREAHHHLEKAAGSRKMRERKKAVYRANKEVGSRKMDQSINPS